MDKVDEALKWADHHLAPGPAVDLAAEVRRLRDVPQDAREYKPSAYELAEILLQIPSKPGTSGAFDLEAMAARIQQDRARILDEAAERGVQKLLKLICEDPIKPWIEGKEELRAAIKGDAHE